MRGLIESSAKFLNQVKMIRFVEHTGTLHSTDLGRTASHYYINTASIEVHVLYVQRVLYWTPLGEKKVSLLVRCLDVRGCNVHRVFRRVKCVM